jgi:transcriptional regulator NrdR family protein
MSYLLPDGSVNPQFTRQMRTLTPAVQAQVWKRIGGENLTERQILARKECPKCHKRFGYSKKTCNCGHEFQMGKVVTAAIHIDLDLMRKARAKHGCVSIRQLLDMAITNVLPTLEKQLMEVGFHQAKRTHVTKLFTPETLKQIDAAAVKYDLSRSDLVILLLAQMAK